MKARIVWLLLLLLVGPLAIAQSTLKITVKNIKETKGTIRVGLFDSEENFLKKVVVGKVVKADNSEVSVVFENIKSGDYAVSIVHDENENGELDSNAFGMPKEGFAFGNNAMGMFGPPSFEKAKISLKNESATQTIDLKYL